MSTSLSGELAIRAKWDGAVLRALDIVSTRPQAAQVLTGRGASEAVKLVPLLFSICAHAQQVAASAAGEAALGVRIDAAEAARRERRVLLESIQEHLWRLLLDWPPLFGFQPERELFAAWHRRCTPGAAADAAACRRLAADLLQLCDENLLPYPLAQWGKLTEPASLRDGRAFGNLSPLLRALFEFDAPRDDDTLPALLPPLSAREFAARWPDADCATFARAPTFDGAPRETGALAQRQREPLFAALIESGRRLLARVVARIGALLASARALAEGQAAQQPVDSHAAGAGIGLACVQTARGLLMHRVQMNGDRIASYAIVAPTEWNFHPAGALAREARGRRFADEAGLLRWLRAAVLALDPCVAYRVEVVHA